MTPRTVLQSLFIAICLNLLWYHIGTSPPKFIFDMAIRYPVYACTAISIIGFIYYLLGRRYRPYIDDIVVPFVVRGAVCKGVSLGILLIVYLDGYTGAAILGACSTMIFLCLSQFCPRRIYGYKVHSL